MKKFEMQAMLVQNRPGNGFYKCYFDYDCTLPVPKIDGSKEWPLFYGRGNYHWFAYRDRTGVAHFAYGCEVHPLASWTDSLVKQLLARYDSDDTTSNELCSLVRELRLLLPASVKKRKARRPAKTKKAKRRK